MPFQQQVFWITGASSGIGEALAYALHRQGARLILSSRRTGELERVRANCKGDASRVKILPLDLADTDSHSALVGKAVTLFGRIDTLVNNGGISQRGAAHETELAVLRQVMEINFFGTVNLTRELLPHMMERKSGHIVVISSVMGKFGTRDRAAYTASKHAIQGWFDCLRQEAAEFSIDVSLICPGYVRTNVTINALRADGSRLGKMGRGQEEGMLPEKFVQKLLPALEKRKREVYIGGKEVAAVYLKRWFPGLLERVLRRVRVT